MMRSVLRYAVREVWLLRSPFEYGAPLIEKASEVRRERVLTTKKKRDCLVPLTAGGSTYER